MSLEFVKELLKQLLKIKPSEYVQAAQPQKKDYPYVSVKEYLKGREEEYPLTSKLEENMHCLLERINLLREKYGKPFIINSGYRPGRHNLEAGGSNKSAHLTCEAIDIRDASGDLKRWMSKNMQLLEELDLYMEMGSYTPTWLHLQTRPTKSGNRVFRPY